LVSVFVHDRLPARLLVYVNSILFRDPVPSIRPPHRAQQLRCRLSVYRRRVTCSRFPGDPFPDPNAGSPSVFEQPSPWSYSKVCTGPFVKEVSADGRQRRLESEGRVARV